MDNPINYLQKVEIYGLWGRYDLVWDLHPDVNVLAGINGSGKTTVLDCICGLITKAQIPNTRLGMFEKVNLFFNNNKKITHQYIKGKDTIRNIEKKAKQNKIYKSIISDLKEEEGKKYNQIKSVEVEFESHATSFEDLQMTCEQLNDAINVDVISTFDAELKPLEAVQKLSDNRVRTELDWEIHQLQIKYMDYQLNMSRKKDAIFKENQGNHFIDNVVIGLKELTYPQKRFLEIIDELFLETNKKINRDKNQLEFLLGDREINAYQLSSGEKQLLIILLTVLVQDNKPSILLMDEPEISLHIEWQRKLIKYIRTLNPNAQVIIATHSPDIIMKGWMDKVFNIEDITVKDNLKA